MRKPLTFGGVALVLIGLLTWMPEARAATVPRVEFVRAISGKSPFPGGACPAGQLMRGPPDPALSDTAVEPAIAADPGGSANVVATWMTAEFQVYGGAVSMDGGRTWRRFEAPGLTHCTGGPADVSDDPGVSFGAGHKAFLTTQANDPAPEAILVSRSINGGLSWSDPIVVDRANTNDKQRSPVAVDPANPRNAYLTWTRLRGPEAADVYFSSSADGGLTWEPATPAYLSLEADLRPLHNLVHVLPGHVLLDTFVQLHTSNAVGGLPRQRDELMALRSTNGGTTWFSTQIGTTSDAQPEDPASAKPVSAEPVLYSDVAPDGSVYVVWNDIASTTSSRIMVSRSSDGGQSWTPPTAAATVHGQAFLPALAIDRDGTIGVTWYDTRRYHPGDRQLRADYWFADSADQGRHWRQLHVAGPFDLRSAYYRPGAAGAGTGYFLGDYDGLAALPDGFAADFAASKPLARVGMSQVFFARIALASPPAVRVLLPRRRACTGHRPFTVRVSSRTRDPLSQIVVRVNHHARKTIHPHRFRLTIKLVHLPRGRLTITIQARTRGGKTVRRGRTYRACTTHRTSHAEPEDT